LTTCIKPSIESSSRLFHILVNRSPDAAGAFENLADLRYYSMNKSETVVSHPLGERDEDI